MTNSKTKCKAPKSKSSYIVDLNRMGFKDELFFENVHLSSAFGAHEASTWAALAIYSLLALLKIPIRKALFTIWFLLNLGPDWGSGTPVAPSSVISQPYWFIMGWISGRNGGVYISRVNYSGITRNMLFQVIVCGSTCAFKTSDGLFFLSLDHFLWKTEGTKAVGRFCNAFNTSVRLSL